jgi:hypothetical protein
MVTSNRAVQDWGAYLGDNTMSSTILDRLMHHCHSLEFDGRSYRLKEAAEILAKIQADRVYARTICSEHGGFIFSPRLKGLFSTIVTS